MAGSRLRSDREQRCERGRRDPALRVRPHQREVSTPALADICLFLFPATFEPVHAGLERLKAWSDERYERGRRLVLTLHEHVEDTRDDERTQGLADLRAKLDLPKPR